SNILEYLLLTVVLLVTPLLLISFLYQLSTFLSLPSFSLFQIVKVPFLVCYQFYLLLLHIFHLTQVVWHFPTFVQLAFLVFGFPRHLLLTLLNPFSIL